jgi:hypothetical protein
MANEKALIVDDDAAIRYTLGVALRGRKESLRCEPR